MGLMKNANVIISSMNELFQPNLLVTSIIVVITYIGIAIGRWPIFKSNRATIALIGVGALLVFRQIQFSDMPGYLDFNTLILLFSMMVINANLKFSGFFSWIGGFMTRTTRSPRLFLAIEILVIGLLSSLFLNDTICLMFTPFILTLMDNLKRNPIPYLIALATASNIGSVATLTGNPQNMIIGNASGIPFTSFTLALFPAALAGCFIIWIVIYKLYPGEFAQNPYELPEMEKLELNRSMILKSSMVIIGMAAAFIAGVPVALAAFLAACVLLLTRKTEPHLVFAEFDWGLLVFFSGLFIVSGSLETSHVTEKVFSMINLGVLKNLWGFSTISVILSNLVSNVPAVLLLKPIIPTLVNAQAGWLALALSSTLAGNLTLLGSVANLIVAETASRWRVEISFWEYTKAGAIITLFSLIFGIIWLQITVW